MPNTEKPFKKMDNTMISSSSGSNGSGSGSGSAAAVRTRSHLTVFIVMVVVWILVHGSFIPYLGNEGGVPSQYGTVSPENIAHVQHLLDDSKALLQELKTSDIPLSSHTSADLESIGKTDSWALEKQLRELEVKYKEAQAELAHQKTVNEDMLRQVNGFSHAHESIKIANDRVNISSYVTDVEKEPKTGSTDNWLVIGIPTVARSENQDYLLQTLMSINQQLPSVPDDILFRRVKVIVVNIEGPSHKRFYEAQTTFSDRRYFEFVTLSEEYKASSKDFQDVKRGATAENDQGNANIPGYRVRKQTRSVAQVLKRAGGYGKYYLFLEDDMLLCPNGFLSIQYILNKASRYAPNWLAIRASYGLNGIFIHDKDINHFYHYLIDNQARRPPDHLAVEWFAGESNISRYYKGSREHMAYRFNIFDHIGISSTLRSAKQTSFPRCYESLGEPTLFKVEAFNPRMCPTDDIWPCQMHTGQSGTPSDRAIVRWFSHLKK